MVDIAAKQRYVLLLKKVRGNQPLTATEIRELKGYEEMAKKKKIEPRKTAASVFSKKAKPDKRSAATERAAFLEKLEELAGAVGVTVQQAADRLEMTPAAFVKLLAADAEAGKLWRHAKTDALVRAGNLLWTQANDGNTAAARQILESLKDTVSGADLTALPPKAAAALLGENTATLDYWYRKHGAPKSLDGTYDLKRLLAWFRAFVVKQQTFDPMQVKLVDLEPFLGVTRQTINEWLKAGLPRNADKTFSLPAVFEWRIRQLGLRPQDRPAAVNPYHAKKAERLQLDLDVARGKVVERVKVELGLAARAGVIVGMIERKGAELPTLLANLTADNVKPILDDFFASLRQAAATVPEDIASVLPPGRVEKVTELLRELARDE